MLHRLYINIQSEDLENLKQVETVVKEVKQKNVSHH